MEHVYVIDHPQGESWIPEEQDTRKWFAILLSSGAVGRWEIETRDGQTVRGYVKETYTAPPMEEGYRESMFPVETLPKLLSRCLRVNSQTNQFLYNIRILRLYTDSTGKSKPEFIITRPDHCTTNFERLGFGGGYACESNWDINRPKPAFATD